MKKTYIKAISVILTITLCLQSISIIASAQTAVDSVLQNEEQEYAYAIAEDISKREESVKYFRMSDGSMTAVSYASPVHYIDEQGEYTEIDNTLIETEENYTNNDNSFVVTLPKESNGEVIVENENKKISFSLVEAKKVKTKIKPNKSKTKKQVDEEISKAKTKKEKADIINSDKYSLKKYSSGVIFENVSDNVDVSYDIYGNNLKESIVLNKKNARSDYAYNFTYSGLTAVLNDDNSVSFIDGEKEYFVLQAPYMIDNNGVKSTDIDVILTPSETGCVYELVPNKKWLNDKERAYPVIIDPTITPKLTALDIKDATAVFNSYDSTMENWAKNFLGSTSFHRLAVGRYPNSTSAIEAGICIYAPIPSGIPATARIIDAKLNLKLAYASDEDYAQHIRLDAFQITSNWNTANINEDSILFTTPKSGGYAIPQINNNAIDYTYISNGIGNYHAFDITKAAQAWQHGENNYGIMLRMDEYLIRDHNYLLGFYSSDASGQTNKPLFTFSYRDTTGLEDYWSYHNVGVGNAGVGYINDFSGSLTFLHNDTEYINERYSVSLSHVYNTNNATVATAYGNGWNLNIGEFGSETIESVSYYYYKDADGTKHYFYNDNGTYKDEDGLGYVYSAVTGNYTAQVTTKNHETLLFDSSGRLRRVTDSNSNSVDFYYETLGLSSVKFGESSIISLSYSGGKLSQITNNKTGHIINYTYDSSGNLITIQHVWDSENTDTYSYTYADKKLISATDSSGYRVSYEYVNDNNISRVRSVTESALNTDNERVNGQKMTFTYNNGNQTVIEDCGLDGDITTSADNNKMIYQFDVFGQPVSVYDEEGRGGSYKYSTVSNEQHNLLLSSASYGYIPGGEIVKEPCFDYGGAWWSYSGNVYYNNNIAVVGTGSKLFQFITLDKGKYNLSATFYTPSVYTRARMSVLHHSEEMITYSDIDFSEADRVKDEVEFEITSDDTTIIIVFEETGEGAVEIECPYIYKLPYANKTNYLTDGDFDYAYAGYETRIDWQMNQAAFGAEKVSATQYDGTVGTVMCVGPSAVAFDAYNRVYCIPNTYSSSNDVFLLSGWAKACAINSGECTFELTLEISCADGSTITKSLKFNNNITDWQFASMAVPVEKAYNSVKVIIDYSQQLNNGYFDDIQLIKDDAVSYTYDANGNVISAKTAATNSQYKYDGNSRLTSAIDTTGVNFKYSYDDNHNLICAVSDAASVIQYNYNSYGQATSSSVHANTCLVSPEDGKTYYMFLRSTGWYLDRYNKGTVYFVQDRYSGTPNCTTQEYTLTKQADGYYTIGYGERFITAQGSTEGSTLSSGSDATVDAAKFKLVKNFNGGYHIVSKLNEQLCITNEEENWSNTVALFLSPIVEGNNNQIWYFEESAVKDQKPVIKDKAIYAIRGFNDGRYFSASNLTTGSSIGVQTGQENATKFLVEKYNDTSYYHIKVVDTNLAMCYNSDSNSVTLEQYTAGADSQLFAINVHETDVVGATDRYSISINPKADAATYIYAWISDNVHASTYMGHFGCYMFFEEVLYSSSSAVYNEDGTQLVSTTDNATGLTTSYTYDSLGRVSKVQTGARSVENNYDSRNRLWYSVTDSMRTIYNYNDKNLLSTIRVVAGYGTQTYAFDYDSFGNTKKISVGNNVLAQYSYVGNTSLVSQMLYGNSDSISYTYDDDYRVTKKTYTDNSNTGTLVKSATVDYEYDMFGNVYKLKDGFSGVTSQYSYDLIGRITQVKKSDNTWKNIGYDAFDRVNSYSTRILNKTVHSSALYGNIGEIKSFTNTIGDRADSISYKYDAFNRKTSRKLEVINSTSTYTYQKGTNGQDTARVETFNNGKDVYTYTYDNYGNISTVAKNGTVIESYWYNQYNQLDYAIIGNDEYEYTYANGASTNLEFVYKNGTMIKTYGYMSADDRTWVDKLSSFTGTGIDYDAIGNPLNWRDNMSFTWEYGRRLGSVTKGTDNITYTYDADGLRTSKTVNGTKTEYYWLDGILQGQKTGNEHIIFLYDENGKAYGMLVNSNGTEQYYYYLFNLQGDVVGIMNSTGETVAEYSYDAWGSLLSVTGTLADTIGQQNPIRYRGYYYDAETGFYYLQSRYYDPYVQRFLNADGYVSTGQDVSGYNMYAYCGNNPTNMCDYSGTCPHNGNMVEIYNESCLICNPFEQFDGFMLYSEHSKKGTTNPANRNKHQKGQARKQRDNNGEKKNNNPSWKQNPNKRRMIDNEMNISVGERIEAGVTAIAATVMVVYFVANDVTIVGASDDAAITPLLPIIWDNATRAFS